MQPGEKGSTLSSTLSARTEGRLTSKGPSASLSDFVPADEHEPRFLPFAFLLLTFTFPVANASCLFYILRATNFDWAPNQVTSLIRHHSPDGSPD
jgi:hypothetical protein